MIRKSERKAMLDKLAIQAIVAGMAAMGDRIIQQKRVLGRIPVTVLRQRDRRRG